MVLCVRDYIKVFPTSFKCLYLKKLLISDKRVEQVLCGRYIGHRVVGSIGGIIC